MSDWLDVDDSVSELADEIATHLGSTKERVIKLALMLLAVDVGIRIEIPRKEKLDGGRDPNGH